MIVSVGSQLNPRSAWNIGTHNGIFHADEVVGIAVLELALIGEDMHVVRTRDRDELSQLDIVIDVGGGWYDHHKPGFDFRRPTGEKYASAGLVWHKYAENAITNVAWEEKVILASGEMQTIKEEIDREIIIPVDQEDNGEGMSNHTFSFIPKFNPTWIEDTPDYDIAFGRATTTAHDILKAIVKEKIAKVNAKSILPLMCHKACNGILEISAQTMPWLEDVVNYNQTHDNSIKFVIFPYPAGGWAAQCVPPFIDRRFEQLVPFPKEWAGGTEATLPAISGIADATLCHNGRFFARAKTKKAIIDMCWIARNR